VARPPDLSAKENVLRDMLANVAQLAGLVGGRWRRKDWWNRWNEGDGCWET
jgi:hypothetical protein